MIKTVKNNNHTNLFFNKQFPTYIGGTAVLNGLCPSNGGKEERNQGENACQGGVVGKHTQVSSFAYFYVQEQKKIPSSILVTDDRILCRTFCRSPSLSMRTMINSEKEKENLLAKKPNTCAMKDGFPPTVPSAEI